MANGLYVASGIFYLLLAKKQIPLTLSLIFLIGFVGWLPISLLFGSYALTSSEVVTALFYSIRFILMAATLFITAALYSKEDDQKRLFRSWLWSGLILILLGYIQLIFVPNFAF